MTAARAGLTFDMPRGAWDCHVHICGPEARFPYDPDRLYTPPDALPGDLATHLDRFGFDHAVIVQPSIYGTDNRALLDAMAVLGSRVRGVGVLPPDVDTAEVARLDAAGMRGVRFNLVDVAAPTAQVPIDALTRVASTIADFGWHIELQLHIDQFDALDSLFGAFPVPLVLGHFGYPKDVGALSTEGYRAMLRMVEAERLWVKLGGSYRLPAEGGQIPLATQMAQDLVAAHPGQLVWASDWPHTNVAQCPDDLALVNAMAEWVPDPKLRKTILRDNPVRLYGALSEDNRRRPEQG